MLSVVVVCVYWFSGIFVVCLLLFLSMLINCVRFLFSWVRVLVFSEVRVCGSILFSGFGVLFSIVWLVGISVSCIVW